MLARVQSYLLQGIDAQLCEVELDFEERDQEAGIGQPAPQARNIVVGLPDAAVKESLERVKSALANSGMPVPFGRTLVNLAPADVRKEGPLYDLPIAIAMLLAQRIIPPLEVSPTSIVERMKGGSRQPTAKPAPSTSKATPKSAPAPGSLEDDLAALGDEPESRTGPLDPRRYLIAGELALDGRLRPIKGVIAMAALARDRGFAGVIVPAENASEAAVVPGIEAISARTLIEVVGYFTGRIEPEVHQPLDIAALLHTATAEVDFGDVKGQESVKRAIVIAAAGAHNIIMLGPAGTGKSMMAKALPGVLPPLTPEEAIEVTRIFSASGLLQPGQGLVTTRPVRTPHHTASAAAIIGGGSVPRPGEVSMAHRGVLFLDELPEFPREVLETMRQPLEDHVVTIARSHAAVRFPASFMLVAAMNPTPKGDMPTDDFGRRAMDRYMSKISGPLIDRIDIHVEAPAVPWKQLSGGPDSGPKGSTSAMMREQVLKARDRQIKRQGAGVPNSRLGPRKLDLLAPMTEAAKTLLGTAMTELKLSARAYDKIRRVARTIADLEGVDVLDVAHVSEAVQYRLLDRKI